MTTENANTSPIYLLGKTPLSIYLAYKLSAIGENPIIIVSPNNIQDNNRDVIIKEEYALKKHKFTYNNEPYTSDNAKLLIITSETHKLKSEILLLSPKHLTSTPCLIFSDDKDTNIAQSIIGKPIIHAWFNGWLAQDDNIVNLFNNEAEIILNKDCHNLEDCLNALSLLNRTNIKTISTEYINQTYWEQFSIKILGSMLTAKEQQNISQICKHKENRLYINELAKELSSLASFYGANITPDDITRKLYAIPSHYNFRTQKIDSQTISILNHYYLKLIISISDSKLQLPHLNRLMKEIYLRINPF